MSKVTVVGAAGFVGSMTAMRVAERGLADVCLIDIIDGYTEGLALDIRHSAPLQGFEVNVNGTTDYKDTAGSDVVVITAGIARKPGMSRMDLLAKNTEIVGGVSEQIAEHSPDAVVIVVSNPLDEMTYLAAVKTGFDRSKVMGQAGVLDSARLKTNIAEELSVSALDVEAITLGSHGDQMVPLPRLATVAGRPLTEMADEETLRRLFERTANGGAEVVGLLQKGSAYFAPSASTAKMVNAIIGDTKEIFPVCAWLTRQYGITETYVGVPARLGRRGVEEIVELPLNEAESTLLKEAAAAIREKCSQIPV